MSGFTIYLIGILILAGGLALAAYRLGVSTTWISIGVVIIIGLGLMAAVPKTRKKK